MSTQYGFGKIITDGLIVSLDAGDRNSYSGSGTVITDLTGNGRNATLLNGPTFNSQNGGGITYDGADDYFTINYISLTTQPFAVDVWYKHSNNSDFLRGIISCCDMWSSPPTPGWGIGFGTGNNALNWGVVDQNGTLYRRNDVGNLNDNEICNLTLVRNNLTQTLTMYKNGVPFFTPDSLSSSVSLSGNRTTIDSLTWQYAPRGPKGTIYSIKIYDNVNLSQSDVLRNYNVHKSRFGL
jgi:hypothetical protein